MNPAAKRPVPIRETKVSIDFGVRTTNERTGEAIKRQAALMGRTPAGPSAAQKPTSATACRGGTKRIISLPRVADGRKQEKQAMKNSSPSVNEDLSDFGMVRSDEEPFVFGEIIDDQPVVESILTDSSTDPKLGFSHGQLVGNS